MRTVKQRMSVRFLAVPVLEKFGVFDVKEDDWVDNDLDIKKAIKLANTLNWDDYAKFCKKYAKLGVTFAGYGIEEMLKDGIVGRAQN